MFLALTIILICRCGNGESQVQQSLVVSSKAGFPATRVRYIIIERVCQNDLLNCKKVTRLRQINGLKLYHLCNCNYKDDTISR